MGHYDDQYEEWAAERAIGRMKADQLKREQDPERVKLAEKFKEMKEAYEWFF